MKTFKQFMHEMCWKGYKRVPGKAPYSPGSCKKEENELQEDHVTELEKGLHQLDNHSYLSVHKLMMKICNKHGMTGKELHNDFKEKNGKTPDEWIKKENELGEDLRQWFKQKWVRMDTKGNIKGQCAREPGEGKPKCLPQAKAQSLGKEGRAKAAQRKRREDPNPERRGKAINVRTK